MNPKGNEFRAIAPSSRPASREPCESWLLMEVSPSGFWQVATTYGVSTTGLTPCHECPWSQLVQYSIGLALEDSVKLKAHVRKNEDPSRLLTCDALSCFKVALSLEKESVSVLRHIRREYGLALTPMGRLLSRRVSNTTETRAPTFTVNLQLDRTEN